MKDGETRYAPTPRANAGFGVHAAVSRNAIIVGERQSDASSSSEQSSTLSERRETCQRFAFDADLALYIINDLPVLYTRFEPRLANFRTNCKIASSQTTDQRPRHPPRLKAHEALRGVSEHAPQMAR